MKKSATISRVVALLGSEWNTGLLAGAALAVATTTGAALFLTHNRAVKRLVLRGDFPRELLGVLHGSLLYGVKGV